mmetsp:Transcript_17305/g.31176  ORF Transcript_17305/g.31176 Transcript_17305/m.31176 type:complete len:367 (+) Transcript_17305:3808-4908(+)
MEETDSRHSPDTFMTSLVKTKQRQQQLDYPNSDVVDHLASQLDNCVTSLDSRVSEVLRKHEAGFLEDYKAAMYQLQKELKDLKEKANETEIERKKERQIQELTAKRSQFQEEAVELDRACKNLTKEVEEWQQKAESMEEDRDFLLDHIAAAKRQNKRLKQEFEGLHMNEGSVELKDSMNQSMIPSKSESPTMESPSNYFKQIESRYTETAAHLRKQLENEEKILRDLQRGRVDYNLDKGEIEDIFMECIEEVKKEIAARKAKTVQFTHRSPLRKRLEDQEVKLEQFTDADKRKVIELLVSKEDVLAFLYSKLFPDKKEAGLSINASTISNQISNSRVSVPRKSSQANFSAPYFGQHTNFATPPPRR